MFEPRSDTLLQQSAAAKEQEEGPRFVFSFGNSKTNFRGTELKAILGGKGAGLVQMTSWGFPVPPGFIVSTQVWRAYNESGAIPPQVEEEFDFALRKLEQETGQAFGGQTNPLLVSVRSGAPVSMPGMMDTVLNIGLNDDTVEALAKRSNDRRFALDSYRRLISMLGSIALGVPKQVFEDVLASSAADAKCTVNELDERALEKAVIPRFKEVFQKRTGGPFPQDPHEQLRLARDAVIRSWTSPRAIEYRKQFRISDQLGTAVTVQAMVFGNLGTRSATGVGFTRDPRDGASSLYGEFLPQAQGEDVVAGIRTPLSIQKMKAALSSAYAELIRLTAELEKQFHWPQDFEFTVQEDRLYLLQTRDAKSTGFASVRWAADLLDRGIINQELAAMRVEPLALDQLLHPIFDPSARDKSKVLATGLPAGPGAATGLIVFSAEEAVARARNGEKVILVRASTSPDDVHGMIAAAGTLTATGGMTSHAAVVARQLGKPCVVGCRDLHIAEASGTMTIGDVVARVGDPISIDGTTGAVIAGRVPTIDSEVVRVIKGELDSDQSPVYRAFERIMTACDAVRKLGVRANADLPEDAKIAFRLGAEGIGLCRTEHMFFAEHRLPYITQLILSAGEARRAILALQEQGQSTPPWYKAVPELENRAINAYFSSLRSLAALQRDDFYGLFQAMQGRPVTIRTLDPPLHEFLPSQLEIVQAIGDLRGGPLSSIRRQEITNLLSRGDAGGWFKGSELERLQQLLQVVEELAEFNPMLGHRGCRLGIAFPEVTQMQARAMFEAAVRCLKEGVAVDLEIMIPLVGFIGELEQQAQVIEAVFRQIKDEARVEGLSYRLGTMLEVPRSALIADKLAKSARFFSFGTNDLTQMTLGYSRDDAGKFIPGYLELGILPNDPFVSLDIEGVGELMTMACNRARGVRPEIKLGICGEHAGDPATIEFCHGLNLTYVSCAPLRLPIARLSAAQAVVKSKRSNSTS